MKLTGMEMNVNGLDQVKIAELADLLGVSARTIRCYEEIGLLNSVKRAEGGKRVYTDLDVQRLKFIKRLKHISLPLSEMHELQHLYQIHGTNKNVLLRLLELLDPHGGKIHERIQNLMRLKEEILDYRKRIRQKLSREEEKPGRRTS